MSRKISVTTGTRAEYGILRPVLKKINDNENLELCLIVTGTHLSSKHGFTINEIIKDGFKIQNKFHMLPKGNTTFDMSMSLAEGIKNFAKIFVKLKPDINLILGDRDEMLASALAGYHMNIPNAHIHGGDRSQGGIDEYNRHAITKISNIHFAATEKSHQRIIKMGENPKYVFRTGSPSLDEIKNNKITSLRDLNFKYNLNIEGKEIILLYHPVTTQIEQSRNQIKKILSAIKSLKHTTIIIGPNTDPGHKEILDEIMKFSHQNSFIHFYKTIPRADFLSFLKYAGVLVGNSSGGIIEASIFTIPVINIGIRQNGREHGENVTNILNYDAKLIESTIKKSLSSKNKLNLSKIQIYGNGNASKKIVNKLEKIKLDKKLIQKQIFY
jgi:UDP-N-acetylglucosamine 2-epimerase (non-hydrolysing)/GDP/UDP-N,N'-diacetylbacillosamine 2-epimerase (hydrolysing)